MTNRSATDGLYFGPNNMTKDKILAMMYGCAIGDALGFPVEGFSAARIAQQHPGGVRGYEAPRGHRHFNGLPAGTVTDDTQFAMVVMDALVDGPDMDRQAKFHVESFAKSKLGAGGTTREALRLLANGVSWRDSGQRANGLGYGNGVVMKLPGLAADTSVTNQFVTDLAVMTHATRTAAWSAVAHTWVLRILLEMTPDETLYFPNLMTQFYAAHMWSNMPDNGHSFFDVEALDGSLDQVWMKRVKAMEDLAWNHRWADVWREFENGNARVYNSLPFTYAFFAKQPDVEGLLACVNAGGDTDTNGSIFASMLGAWRGMRVWEERPDLLQLPVLKDIGVLVDRFCTARGIR